MYLNRTLEVAGAINVVASPSLGVSLYLGYSAHGTINVLSGGTLNFDTGAYVGLYNGAIGGEINVLTGGTLTRTNIPGNSGGSATISTALNILGGTVSASSGSLNLSGGGSSTGGVLTAATGASVNLNGGSFDLSGNLTGAGAGTVQFSGGTLSVAQNKTASLNNLTMSGGTIDGAGTLTINGLTWTGGSMNGTGKTVVAAGTSGGSIGGGGSYMYLNRTLEVAGAINVVASPSLGVSLYLGYSAHGTINVLSGGTLNFDTGAYVGLYNGAIGGEINVLTGGTLTRTNIPGNSGGSATISTALNILGGTVSASSGSLNLSGGGSSTGGVLTAATGASVNLNGGSFDLSGNLTGAGAGTVQFSGGTLSVAQNKTASLNNLTMSGGTIDGAGTLTINGLTWTGGSMNGTGKTVVAAGTSSTVGGVYAAFLNRTLEVGGTLHVLYSTNSGVSIYFGQTAHGTINVVGGGTLDVADNASFLNYNSGGGEIDLQTGGTLSKSGSGSVTISTAVNILGGTVSATVGTLFLAGGGSDTGGTIAVSNGAIFYFYGGTFDLSGTLTGSGAGSIQLIGGSLSVAQNITASIGNLTMSGGTIDGAGILNVSNLTWTSGSMNGSGKTVIVAGTTSTVGGPTLNRTIEVAGTLVVIPSPVGSTALYLGQTGHATVNILSGGTLSLPGSSYISNYTTGSGEIIVQTGGTIIKTNAGNASLSTALMLPGGGIDVQAGGLYLQSGIDLSGAGLYSKCERHLVERSGVTFRQYHQCGQFLTAGNDKSLRQRSDVGSDVSRPRQRREWIHQQLRLRHASNVQRAEARRCLRQFAGDEPRGALR